MHPFASAGVYVIALEEEGENRVRAGYGNNYGRLLTLKNKYGPANLFRLN